MKKVLSLCMALVLCAALVIPAAAVTRNGVYVQDENDYLNEEDHSVLNQRAQNLSDEYGIDLLTVLTYEPDIQAYWEELSIGSRDEQIMLVANEKDADIFAVESIGDLLTDEDLQTLLASYQNENSYPDGVEAFYDSLEQILPRRMNTIERISDPGEGSSVVDYAGLLSKQEAEALRKKLDKLSSEKKMDVIVVTAVTLDGKSPQTYAEDFYEFHNYGVGTEYDGVMMLVCFDSGDLYFLTSGKGIQTINDAGIEYLNDRCGELLADRKFTEAFDVYAEFVKNGKIPKAGFAFVKNLLVSLVIGFVIALISVLVMKGKLKSVRAQTGAADYVKKGSLKLNRKQDTFLYRKVDRREKPQNNSSGSTTHRSSSGRTYGGGGSKFK